MFEKNDEQYIINALNRADVILFLGSGFSSNAKNRFDESLPLSEKLAEKIWNFLGYTEPFDNTSLPILYETMLGSGKPFSEISAFLEDNLLAVNIPDEYSNINKLFWYKIYTTNIDNVVDSSYKRGASARLKIISFPSGEPIDRDSFLEQQQLIYLNGKLPCSPNDVIFSIRQYAKSALVTQPLYEQFIREYVNHPTIFVGTSIEEPLFWQYLEERQDRSVGTKEYRPKSFLVAQKISTAKRDYLKKHFNIISIEETTSAFLGWLSSISPNLYDKYQILKNTVPHVVDFISLKGYSENKKELNLFAESFEKVAASKNIKSYRSLFLLGTTPKWEDIHKNLDAPRKITKDILESIELKFKKVKDLSIIALVGSAGCGKSTVLKRIGTILTQSGKNVYYTDSESLPTPNQLKTIINILNEKVILLFDNSEVILNILPSYVQELEKLALPPIIVIASRTYEYDRITSKRKAIVDLGEFTIPTKLDRDEIINIISVLEENNLLGYLKGLKPNDRIKEFEGRSSKQLLVAMREATTGRGFDEILNSEFKDIYPEEAKILALCVALATDVGYSISKEDFVGFTDIPPGDSLNILYRTLQDICIIDANIKIYLRHKTIAAYLVEEHVNRELLKVAYIRILQALSISTRGKNWREKRNSLSRNLLYHRIIYRRFNKQISCAREIYDSLAKYLSDDYHFWLQYANLELEGRGGDLQFAENYLNQAESLSDSYYITTARGQLLLKKGVQARTKAEAIKFKEEGEEIILNLIQTRGYEDPYFYHIYCYQIYNWIKNWTTLDDNEKKQELQTLKDICEHGTTNHPKNKILADMLDSITKALYYLTIDSEKRPPDPIILLDY
jgi:energy-coupling factor transporter ATP-binding protein EcfA2